MKSKFASKCTCCGHMVPAGEGETNKVYGRWRTSHVNRAECEILRLRNQTSTATNLPAEPPPESLSTAP